MDIFNTVCRDLPGGYLLTIELEKGGAHITIEDPKKKNIDFYLDDTPFLEQVEMAVKWCIEHKKVGYRPPRYDAVFRRCAKGLLNITG